VVGWILVGIVPDMPEMLDRLRTGDESSLNQLTATLYRELRRIASLQLRAERPSHTLQTTALVHEAYLKLVGEGSRGFVDRVHFLAVASRVMRQVLVDYARARATQKRDANATILLTTGIEAESKAPLEPIELLDLDVALGALAREDQSLERLIEMHYFGGMSAEETAAALGQSVHVVRHDLRLAQAWLRRKLGRSSP
jgi:RNA polymerase sigma factor (TIGR02999 family)